MDEPTVLDYLKSKLAFWRHAEVRIPDEDPALPYETPGEGQVQPAGVACVGATPASPIHQELVESLPVYTRPAELDYERAPLPAPEDEIPVSRAPFPWRVILALVVALFAQHSLNPPSQNLVIGSILYGVCAALTIWAVLAGEFRLNPLRGAEEQEQAPVRWQALAVGGPLALFTFLLFGDGLFTPVTLTAWFVTLGVCCYAFWAPAATPWLKRAWAFIRQPRWRITITPWMILVFLVALGALFFRVYRLADVPAEMVSDHAEKLLDIRDVLNGQTAVFFPRNSGREFFEFYLCAALIRLFNTGLTFMTMKLAMTIMGLLTLPYMYLLGKEIGNKRVALFALAFAGMAYWPNVVTRGALRNTLYAAFYAPMLYYLFRGLRRSNRNDFIYSGIALGIGLNGYTSYRVVPIVVLVAMAIYLFHHKEPAERKRVLTGLVVMSAVAFIIFIPLFRYTLSHPDQVLGRSLTRLTSEETQLPGPAWQIFLSNFWAAITMFFWSDGTTWVHSVPLRPALDTVSAALFLIGALLMGMRYWKRRNWVDLFTLVSVPLLLMPSIMALAFPAENPSLNRTMAAIVPVFLITALGLDEIITSLSSRLPRPSGAAAAWAVALVLVGWSAWGNFDLAFNQFATQYRLAAWNTSEVGRVIRGFADSVGTVDSAYVVAYPYWVDTRLVGINAGVPIKDYAITIDQISETKRETHAKLFIVNPQDYKALNELRSVYPHGALSTYQSAVPTKDFLIYQVPPG